MHCFPHYTGNSVVHMGVVVSASKFHTNPLSHVSACLLGRMRLKQMEVACAVKCGDVPPGMLCYFHCDPHPMHKVSVYCLPHCTRILLADSPLAHTASTVTDAVIRFELLATELNSPVKLSLGDAVDGSQCKAPGSFVLYNYARMCTVLANFDKAVAAGKYKVSAWASTEGRPRRLLKLAALFHSLASMYLPQSYYTVQQRCPVSG